MGGDRLRLSWGIAASWGKKYIVLNMWVGCSSFPTSLKPGNIVAALGEVDLSVETRSKWWRTSQSNQVQEPPMFSNREYQQKNRKAKLSEHLMRTGVKEVNPWIPCFSDSERNASTYNQNLNRCVYVDRYVIHTHTQLCWYSPHHWAYQGTHDP